MEKKPLALLMALAAAVSASAQSIDCQQADLAAAAAERLQARNIMHYGDNLSQGGTSRAEWSTLQLAFKYDKDRYMPYFIEAFNAEDVRYGYPSATATQATMTLPDGIFTFVMEYYDMQSDQFVFVVAEDINVDLTKGLTFDVATATNLVSFEQKLPNGQVATVDDYDKGTAGTVRSMAVNSVIAHDDIGFFFFSSGIVNRRSVQEYVSGPEMFDFYINDVSDRWHFVQQRISFQTIDRDDSKDAYAAFMTCDGVPEQTITNNPLSYSVRGYLEPFAASPQGADTGNSICFSVLWEGNVHYLSQRQAWGGMPSRRLNHSFSANYDPETSKVMPVYSTQIDEGDGYNTGFALYMPSPDRTITYPLNGFAAHPTISAWRMVDDEGEIDYATYPGHPLFEVTADQLQYTLGNGAPISVARVADLFALPGFLPHRLAFTGKSQGMLGEQRDLDAFNAMATLTRGGIDMGTFLLYYDPWAEEYAENQLHSEFVLNMRNENVAFDGKPGYSELETRWSYNRSDVTPPMLQVLQVRDADNNLCDHLSTTAGAHIYFAAADYRYFSSAGVTPDFDYMVYNWSESNDVKATVEYSAHGANQWQAISAVKRTELRDTCGFGTVFSVPLGKMAIKEDCVDVRITLTDAAGNSQVQTLAPLFMITENGPEYESIGVQAIEDPQGDPVWYTLDGRMVRKPETPGVYICRYPDGKARKVAIR